MAKELQESLKTLKVNAKLSQAEKYTMTQVKAMSQIKLSNKCLANSYEQAKDALLPGNKYSFAVPDLKQREIRIAILGDSIAQGMGSTSLDQINNMPISQRLSDQTDGS